MLIIKKLNFTLDKFFLKIDHLDLSKHKISVLMGPSGSGKTTFFRILIGFYKPQNWSLKLNSIEMSHLSIEERHFGIVFQNNELFPHLTAFENIQIVMRARKAISEQDFAALEIYKKKLNLEKCWNSLSQNLSGGEAQRISLLRAIMSRPKLLLLDEPFSALDAHLKNEARKLTAEIIKTLDIPTIIITHDIEDAFDLNANIIHIQNGEIL